MSEVSTATDKLGSLVIELGESLAAGLEGFRDAMSGLAQ